MEEKKLNKTKVIITSIGTAIVVVGVLTYAIPFFTTPNYKIYYGNNVYNYNSSGLALDSSNKKVSIAYGESNKILEKSSSVNGYVIDLDKIKNDNSNFSLNEKYVDIIFNVTYETTGTLYSASRFELKSNDNVISTVNTSSKGTYYITKVDIKDLSNLELYEKKELTVLVDGKESTVSFTKLDIKVIYFGR